MRPESLYESEKYPVDFDGEFYYTVRDGRIYAITDKFPSESVSFNSVDYRDGMKIRLLGLDGNPELEALDRNGKLSVKLPRITPDDLASEWFYTYEIS